MYTEITVSVSPFGKLVLFRFVCGRKQEIERKQGILVLTTGFLRHTETEIILTSNTLISEFQMKKTPKQTTTKHSKIGRFIDK